MTTNNSLPSSCIPLPSAYILNDLSPLKPSLVKSNPFHIGQLVKAIIPHANGKNTLSPRLRITNIHNGMIYCQLDHFLPSSPVITHIGNATQFIPLT